MEDQAEQVANLEISTVVLQYSSQAFFQRGNITSEAIQTRVLAYKQMCQLMGIQVVSLIGNADYSNYFAQVITMP